MEEQYPIKGTIHIPHREQSISRKRNNPYLAKGTIHIPQWEQSISRNGNNPYPAKGTIHIPQREQSISRKGNNPYPAKGTIHIFHKYDTAHSISLLKDVIVPYTHLLPKLQLSENQKRPTLIYFKGAKHRHRGGLVREKLWDLLVNEPGVVMEEGFPNATGKEQSVKGDTPTSCRLFDAIQSLCIPVIVSDNIELPFEGMTDYS
nr:probable arabinosyltransferase ARAD1 [Ipomoea trifida]